MPIPPISDMPDIRLAISEASMLLLLLFYGVVAVSAFATTLEGAG